MLGAVISAYGLGAIETPPVRQGGAINHVLHVSTVADDIIIRVHRPETTPVRLTAVHRVQDQLRNRGLPIPSIHRTVTGESWISMEGRLVEAELGRFHGAIRTIDQNRLPPPVNACFATPETALHLLWTYEQSLPRTLIHGDFVGNNVLIKDQTVIAILDFDRSAVRHRVHDVAYRLMYVLARLDRTGQRSPSPDQRLTETTLRT